MGLSDLQLQHAAFDLWLASDDEDNRVDMERAKRLLPIVLDECVTPLQKEYILAYYIEGLNTLEMAERYGVTPSTISRTINRGLDTAYSYLRFVSPLFVNIPRRRGRIDKGRVHRRR